MSYAGLGVAIPAFRGGALAARSVPALRARGWGRGIGGYSGSLGASSTATSGGAVSASVVQAATAALSAVKNASEAQLRSSIAAVRTFQSAHGGLTVDGIYGPNTRRALMQVLGRGEADMPPAVSGGGGSVSPGPSPYVPSSSDMIATPIPDASAMPSAESWLVPVAVVSTVVIAAGGLLFMQRRRKGLPAPAAPVAAKKPAPKNRRRRR